MKISAPLTKQELLEENSQQLVYTKRIKGAFFLLFSLLLSVLLMICGSFLIIRLLSQIETLKKEIAQNQLNIQNILEKLNLQELKASFKNSSMPPQLVLRQKRQSKPFALIAAHLVGTSGRHDERPLRDMQVPPMGNYFEWTDRNERSIDQMAVLVLRTERGTFLQIQKTGYYFVYAQLTYFGMGRHPIGHATVRIRPNEERVLMEHINTQRRGSTKRGIANQRSNMDSGYHGGLFLLFSGDKIGVRPAMSNMSNRRFNTDDTKSFFGVYFVSA